MSKSSGSSQRELTQEEKDLISTQEDALKQAMDVYTEQFNLSKTDRDYFDKIYRGDLDPNDPKVKEEVANRLKNTPQPTYAQFVKTTRTTDDYGYTVETTSTDMEAYDKAMQEWNANKDKIVKEVSSDLGGIGVDEALFKSVMDSDSNVKKAFTDWQSKAQTLGTSYTDKISGLSKDFTSKLTTIGNEMGTANKDVLAQTTASNLAGLSQSYAEARKQLEGTLAQRGLSDSGVGVSALGQSYNQEAMAKANALGISNQQAIAQSDALRQQQMSIAGTIYNTDLQTANTAYGIQSGLDTAQLQNTLNANQQNISNLTTMSGVSQGVYGGSQNYLSQAGTTANQTASTAGSTAVGIGNMQSQYAQAQISASAAETSALYGAVGSGIGAYAGYNKLSDFRFKNNIKYVETIDGVRYYTWEWNDFAKEYLNGDKLYEPYGVIAQELIVTNPELVFIDDNGYMFVDYSGLKGE